MKVKEEVRKLCEEFRKEPIGTERWHQLEDELKHNWKFSAWNLLALFQNPPAIEVNDENFSLVTE